MSVGSGLLSGQHLLQRLPVPDLNSTIEKYLKTLDPLFCEDEVLKVKALSNDFVTRVGPRLQKLLIERDKKEPNSWLERWWNRVAYLGFRESNVINSNFAMPFRSFPNSMISQSRRAALICRAVLEYKGMIDDGSLKPDKQPNDQLAHTRLFDACRVPNPECDFQKRYQAVNHIVVMCKDVFWSLKFRKDESSPLPLVSELEAAFEAIKLNSATFNKTSPAIGIGTYLHRDRWTEMRSRLVEFGNLESLELIQSASFVLCLDDCTPKSANELMDMCLMGDSVSCSNRWYDKPIQIMIAANGEGGLNGEHSPVDGEIVARMVEWVLHREVQLNEMKEDRTFGVLFSKRLQWNVDYDILNDIRHGLSFACRQIDNVQTEQLTFTAFGKKGIVIHKMSPDAFFQASLQLAYHRLHQKFAPTYESVSTRRHLAGRTETGRSLTSELANFVQLMEQGSASVTMKREALKIAATAHVNYMKEAGKGYGVDRHLLGLRLIAQENNVSHPFLSNHTLSESCHWRLSTSQLAVKNLAVGFGPVVPDGYGVCYQIHPDKIVAVITSFRDNIDTDSLKLAKKLENAFFDLRSLFITHSNL